MSNHEFPFPTATGLTYDSGDYSKPLKEALAQVDYPAVRREQEKARKEGKLMGIGISTYGEICAMGPSIAMPAGGWESATVKVEPSGKVDGSGSFLIGEIAYALKRGEGLFWGCIHQVRPPLARSQVVRA